jgi:hypothetical protein
MMQLRSNHWRFRRNSEEPGRIIEQLCRHGDKMKARVGIHEAEKRGLDESLGD